tara:strand:- start:1011 stop:1223 length:213 start_codon:yes stop_codon:yes gene_type:complete
MEFYELFVNNWEDLRHQKVFGLFLGAIKYFALNGNKSEKFDWIMEEVKNKKIIFKKRYLDVATMIKILRK